MQGKVAPLQALNVSYNWEVEGTTPKSFISSKLTPPLGESTSSYNNIWRDSTWVNYKERSKLKATSASLV